MQSVSLFNPLNLERPLAYVDKMHASLLSSELDANDWSGDRVRILELLDTAEQAFLMMALAGMEYYPVGIAGEEDLDATLASVVAHGNPHGDTSQSTGLSLLTSIKKTQLGFRADIVPVEGRPHYVVAVRGTQVKQPSFVQTVANGLADLSAVALEVDKLPLDVQVESFLDLMALKRQLEQGLSFTDFSENKVVAHAGIFLSATMLEGDIHDAMISELSLEYPDEQPCAWLTGHSLGADLVGFRIVAFMRRFRWHKWPVRSARGSSTRDSISR